LDPNILKIIRAHDLASKCITTDLSKISVSLKKLQAYLSYCVQKEIELYDSNLSKEEKKLVEKIMRNMKNLLSTQSRILSSIESELKIKGYKNY